MGWLDRASEHFNFNSDEGTRQLCIEIEQAARGRGGGREGPKEKERERTGNSGAKTKRTFVHRNHGCALPEGLDTKMAGEKE